MLESIFTAAETTETTFTLWNAVIALCVALVLGFILSFCYIKTHKDKNPAQNFVITLVMLPAIITVIIMLVGNNVASAFSLAGVFTIVRFRSAPGDSKDITYILFSAAIGLSCGLGFVWYAAFAAVALCIIMVVLEVTKFGKNKKSGLKLLKITIPENLDYRGALDDVMRKYTSRYELKKIKTTELGSLYELQYDVITVSDTDEKAFIDELRCRNGNLSITLVMHAVAEGM